MEIIDYVNISWSGTDGLGENFWGSIIWFRKCWFWLGTGLGFESSLNHKVPTAFSLSLTFKHRQSRRWCYTSAVSYTGAQRIRKPTGRIPGTRNPAPEGTNPKPCPLTERAAARGKQGAGLVKSPKDQSRSMTLYTCRASSPDVLRCSHSWWAHSGNVTDAKTATRGPQAWRQSRRWGRTSPSSSPLLPTAMKTSCRQTHFSREASSGSLRYSHLIYCYFWLRWVLVAARGMVKLCCGLWDL